ncbi:MAG: hypothetical protein M1831_004043 [Alyxoria varia]|nr:MAG: hypothetical protein M1831_004043 [Alyxoria varia]
MTHHHVTRDTNRAPDQGWRSSTATLHSFHLGTGHGILTSATSSLLHSTTHELLFVTCFWAPSTSSTHLRNLLLHLSRKALTLDPNRKIRVRLCFSSRSVLQKLTHTGSLDGHVLKREEVVRGLGLPDPWGEEMRGLDLQVKSVFQLPFCVMHPKFVVVDRRYCVLPSCNVSWERWFEGALVVGGPVVGEFVRFWRDFWGGDGGGFQVAERIAEAEGVQSEPEPTTAFQPSDADGDERLPISIRLPSSSQAPSTFLIHPPHRNPNFRPLFLHFPRPPNSPLNTYLLHLFNTRARHTITISTPNLTSPPAIAALKTAMTRGVHVQIYTDESVMVAEQIVTAGTTTSRKVKQLIRWHESQKGGAHRASAGDRRQRDEQRTPLATAEEGRAGLPAEWRLGRLTIRYFTAGGAARGGNEVDQSVPEHLHFKMTAVDVDSSFGPPNGEIRGAAHSTGLSNSSPDVSGRSSGAVVLGSGNMDRASWYTSQEVGLAIENGEAADRIVRAVKKQLDTRTRLVYDG